MTFLGCPNLTQIDIRNTQVFVFISELPFVFDSYCVRRVH